MLVPASMGKTRGPPKLSLTIRNRLLTARQLIHSSRTAYHPKMPFFKLTGEAGTVLPASDPCVDTPSDRQLSSRLVSFFILSFCSVRLCLRRTR
jgi:hypothetical protein